MKKLLAIALIATCLVLSACKKDEPVVETVEGQTKTETETKTVSTEVSVKEESTNEPVPTYTLQDCFGGSEVIDSVDEFDTYINSRKAVAIRSFITKRTYKGGDMSDSDNSEIETLFSYQTYVGYIAEGQTKTETETKTATETAEGQTVEKQTETEKRRVDEEFLNEVQTKTVLTERTFNDSSVCVPFIDVYGEVLPEEPTISDIYKAILTKMSLNEHFESMFVSADTEVTEDAMNEAIANGTYRVISDTPANVVYDTILADVSANELTMADFSYDLSSDGIDTIIPTYVGAFAQYTDINDNAVTYAVNVALITYDDVAPVEEWLTVDCACGDGCTCGCDGSDYTFTEMDATKYAKSKMNVRDTPSIDGEAIGSLALNDEVHVTGQCNETGWYRFEYNGGVGYGNNDYLVDEKVDPATVTASGKPAKAPNGNALVWEGGVHGLPYSEDGIRVRQVVDEGDTVCIYGNSYKEWGDFASGTDFSYWFGQLQLEAEALYMSKGHSTCGWHLDTLPNGMCRWWLSE